MKTLIVISIVIISVLAHEKDDLRIIDSIYQEPPCSTKGGICTIAGDCPPGRLALKRNMCPEQRRQGVECCYGISVKETRCEKRGGECFIGANPCRSDFIIPKNQATNCPENTTCCVLLK